MTTATVTVTKNSPEVNRAIANTILEQVGVMVRGCLDMKKCYTIENGVIAKNAIIGTSVQNFRRGDISITLNGLDLYDVELSRINKRTFEKTITKEWNNVDVSSLRSVLDSIWR